MSETDDTFEITPAIEIAQQLRDTARATLTLTRSSKGKIKLEMRTQALGAITMAMDDATFTRLLFGEAETPVAIERVNLRMKPTR
jgi:hypothetical protein